MNNAHNSNSFRQADYVVASAPHQGRSHHAEIAAVCSSLMRSVPTIQVVRMCTYLRATMKRCGFSCDSPRTVVIALPRRQYRAAAVKSFLLLVVVCFNITRRCAQSANDTNLVRAIATMCCLVCEEFYRRTVIVTLSRRQRGSMAGLPHVAQSLLLLVIV